MSDIETTTVLLIEDQQNGDPRIRQMLEEPPCSQFVVEMPGEFSGALRRLEDPGIDIVLLNLARSHEQSLDRFLQVYENAAEIPIVVLNDTEDARFSRQAVQTGAQDYLSKEHLDGNALARSLRNALERSKVVSSLRESEGRKAAILDTAMDCIVGMDHKGTVTEWNKAAEVLFGYSRMYAMGREMADLIIPHRFREQHRKGLERFLETGEGPVIGQRIEIRAVSFRGLEFPVELAVTCNSGSDPPAFTGVIRDITGQKQALETLEFSKIAMEQTSTGFVISDMGQPDSPLIYVNPAFERITGYSGDEALGRNCRFLQGVDTEPELVEKIRKAVLEGRGCQVVLKNYRKDGTPFWNDLRISPIFDSDGTLTHYVGVQNDITQQKRAEKKQEQLAHYNRLLLQSTGEGIYGIDLNGNCTFINQAGGRMLNVEPEEVMGRNMHMVTHHTYADGSPYPMEECPIYKAFKRGVSCRIDNEVFWRADHTSFPVEYSSFPILEEDLLHGAVVTFADITERKQTEEALRDSESRYQRIAANVPGMVYQFVLRPDASMDFPFVSEGSRELYGLEPETIKSNAYVVIDAIHPDDRAGFDASVLESATSLTPWKWEGRFLHPSGEWRWLEGASRPQKEENGDILWDGLLMDTTARKLAEVELQQAKEGAEAATLAKSQFLATMSHEIRTPMNAVIGMTGLLLDTELSAEQTEYAQIIRDSGDALLTIINDILDYSKIEAGQLEMEYNPFDLRDCMEASLDLLAARATEKGLDLATIMDPDVPLTVMGDVTRVRQILVNLLSNSVKFTETGEVVLSLAGRPLTGDIYELHFTVRDTGIGIPSDRMNRLFRSFSQVDASTTRRYGGTGLGLAISKKLCELMKGSIRVESVVGQGSSFHVVIPMKMAETPPRPALELSLPHLDGKRILIVDDNATNRQILTLQSQSWKMVARECASSVDALELIRRDETFDLAILDIQMPDMDGISLANEIRRYRDSKQLPLIGLSSVGQRGADVTEGRFDAMLTKPIKQSQLYNVLVEVLSLQDTAPRSTRSTTTFDPTLGIRLPLRILLAEDLAVNQKLMLNLLSKYGYRADVAGTGLEVLAAVARQKYDVILMDVQMPEMDGLEASRRLCRRYAATVRPRIVALTANAMQEDRQACTAAGMDDYLAKPISASALQDALIRSGEWARQRAGAALTAVSQDIEQRKEKSDMSFGTDEPVFTPAGLDTLREMSDFLPELLEAFANDVDPMLKKMRSAVESGNAAMLKESAHGIKGIAANLGAGKLAALCQTLEAKGREGTVAGAAELIPSTEIEINRLRAALEQVIGELR